MKEDRSKKPVMFKNLKTLIEDAQCAQIIEAVVRIARTYISPTLNFVNSFELLRSRYKFGPILFFVARPVIITVC